MISQQTHYLEKIQSSKAPNSFLVDIHSSNTALRSVAEKFITDCFNSEYSATVQYFLEHHILSFDHGTLQSVVGYQIAGKQSLYLEQYLNRPVEKVISHYSQSNTAIERSSLIEVGNLASISPGSFRRLILSLCRYFSDMGASWVVFTSTPQLINTFNKLGMELIQLGDAQSDDLKKGAADWGSYYQQKPKVMAGNIGNGYKQLLGNDVLKRLLERAPTPVKIGA